MTMLAVFAAGAILPHFTCFGASVAAPGGRLLIQFPIQTSMNFDGNLPSRWTKVAAGILLFACITMQQGVAGLAKPPDGRAQGVISP